ncbi:MAG: hypothetical protein FWD16_03945, partial [Clostridia bacterium]|nr:hypothetical protein [Clostridia bacterium]
MALIRCPRCELNYIQADEKVCEVCRRQMHGLREEVEELCVECGTRPVASGEDVCRVCLREALGRASLVAQVVTVADEPLDTEEEEEDTVPV